MHSVDVDGTLKALRSFGAEERVRLPTRGGTDLAHLVGEIERYLHFVCIIHDRYFETEKVFRSLQQQLMASLSAPVSSDWSRVDSLPNVMMRLQLDIESMYLFGKTFIDRIANTIGFYFGEARRCSFISHDQFLKCLELYAKTKGLTIPSGFLTKAKELSVLVIEVRDKLITHKVSTRHTRGIGVDVDDKTSMLVGGKLPTKGTGTHSTEPIDVLLSQFCAYLMFTLEFLKSNSACSALLLKA